jgi:hypothetical protein
LRESAKSFSRPRSPLPGQQEEQRDAAEASAALVSVLNDALPGIDVLAVGNDGKN